MSHAKRPIVRTREQAPESLRDGVGAVEIDPRSAQRVLDGRGDRWESSSIMARVELTTVEMDAVLRMGLRWGLCRPIIPIISESLVQSMAVEIAEVIWEGLRRVWEACAAELVVVFSDLLLGRRHKQPGAGGSRRARGLHLAMQVREVDHPEPAVHEAALEAAFTAYLELVVDCWRHEQQGVTA